MSLRVRLENTTICPPAPQNKIRIHILKSLPQKFAFYRFEWLCDKNFPEEMQLIISYRKSAIDQSIDPTKVPLDEQMAFIRVTYRNMDERPFTASGMA